MYRILDIFRIVPNINKIANDIDKRQLDEHVLQGRPYNLRSRGITLSAGPTKDVT